MIPHEAESPLWAGLLVLGLSLAAAAVVIAIWNAIMILRLASRASSSWVLLHGLVPLLMFFPCVLSSLVKIIGRWIAVEEWAYAVWLLLYPSAALIQWLYLRRCLER